MSGIPVVIAANGLGTPVRPVEKNAPMLQIAENGLGAPIVISDRGAPFIVNGLVPPPDPVPSFDWPGISVSFYDPSIPFDNGIVLHGIRPISYSIAGTGAAPASDENGLTFYNGQYLQANPTGAQAYERMILLVDITVNAAIAGNNIQVDQDATQRFFLKTTNNGQLQGQGPGNLNTLTGEAVVTLGQRQCVAMIWDRTGASIDGFQMGWIADDGYFIGTMNGNPMADIVLNNMRIGQGASVTLHRMALIGAVSGSIFPDTPINLWRGFAQRNVPSYDVSRAWVFHSTGHSLNACRPLETGFPSALWTRQDRRGTKMLASMLNTTAQAVPLEGPLWGTVNTAIPATIDAASVNGNMTNMSAASVALHKWRGNGSPEHLVYCTAAGGAQAGDLVSGAATGAIFANASYMVGEAQRLLAGKSVERVISAISIGTSDRADAEGVYSAELSAALSAHSDLLTDSFPGATLTEVVYQSPGRMDTTGDPWERVIMAEYDLAESRGALLVPLYPYEATGLNAHPDAVAGTLYGETAGWAVDEVMKGRRWTIEAPTIAREGGLISLTYGSLNDDESISFLPDSFYESPLANRGFEVVGGGVILGVVASGKSIIISTSGAVSGLRYANQRQAVTGQRHFAFRGTAVTTKSRASAMFSDKTLRRWLPSFSLDVAS